MPTQKFAHQRLAVLGFASTAAGLFFLDILSPPGVADGIGYAPSLAISLWMGGKRQIVICAYCLAFLIISAHFLSPPSAIGNYTILNRLLALIALTAMAIFLVHRKKQEAEVAQALIASRESETAKDRFFASASHELRTPLNAIVGHTEAIGMGVFGPVEEKLKNPLLAIESSARHLSKLINSLLALSAVRVGQVEVVRDKVDLVALTQKALDLILPLTSRAGIIVAFEEGAAVYADADPTLALQCLLNVLDNARKFTAKDGTITVSAHTGGGRAVLTIADTGKGMTQIEIENIGHPFRQSVDPERRTPNSGSGLGLAITKSLMELQGGALLAASQINRGTTMRLEFHAQTRDTAVNAISSRVDAT